MFLRLIKNSLIFLLFIINFSFTSIAEENSKKISQHVSLELISSVNSIHKENKLHIGLFFKLDAGWKIYCS